MVTIICHFEVGLFQKVCEKILNIYILLGVIISNLIEYIHIYIYDSKSLDVVQSLYFGSKLPSSGTYK